MTESKITTKRICPGLYEITANTRTYLVERNDGQCDPGAIRGWWYANTPSGNDVIEVATLREMKQSIRLIEEG